MSETESRIEKPDRIVQALETYTPDLKTISFLYRNMDHMKRSEMARQLHLPKVIVNRLVERIRKEVEA